MLPVVGAAADVANGVWYAAEGNYTDAALSFASAVPGVGDAVGAAKLAAKGTAAAVGAVSTFTKATETVTSVSGVVVGSKKVSSAADAARGIRPPNLSPEGAGRNGAFRQAKRDAGIPMSQQPTKVGSNIKDDVRQPGEVYYFDDPSYSQSLVKNSTKKPDQIEIRHDSEGHHYVDDPTQDRGAHFHIQNPETTNHYDY